MTALPAIPSSVQNRNGDRFHIKSTVNLNVELLILQEDEVVRHACQIADISVSGCAVKVSTSNPEKLSVAVLRIYDASGAIDLEVAGRLCWNQQTSVGSNTFGFRFRRLIDVSVIDHMVAAGLVTRRHEERISVGTRVQVRRAHGLAAIESATLQDFSTTGVRIRVDRELQVAERLLITTTSGASGSVLVKWLKPQAELFECGCVFQNLSSARAITDALGC